MYVVVLIVALTAVSVNCQADCPRLNVSELGATDMLTQNGLVGSAFAAVSGDPSLPVSVQVHDSNIVCLRSGRIQDTYTGVSVVVNYTCTGAPSGCNRNPTLSQFEFECVANPVRWAPSVDGSAANIITTPPDGSLSTTLRTDCGVCISPARSVFATITNNDQHCGSCNSACSVGLMRCFNRLNSGCCNFFVNDTCVGSCTSPLVPNSNFDCVADCGLLSSITNGMLSYSAQGQDQTLLGTTVTYTCNTGYTLSGNRMRTCLTNGTWSGSDSTCNPVDCGTLTDPLNGQVTLTATTFMSTATYSCNSGYTLSGSTTRTCEANGTWSDTAPTCDPMDCGTLTNPQNGQVTFTTTTFLSTANYSCNSGYTLSGNETRTCEATGTWSGITPTCDPVDCGTLAAPQNGKVNLTATTFMSTATYSCNSGYILSGSTTRTCEASGTWSNTAPTCDPVDCGNLTNPQNGKITLTTTTFMSTATYSCNSGYTLSGNETRTCEANVTWSGATPTCDPVNCGSLTNPVNGELNLTTTTFMSTSTYSCNAGYTLFGKGTRTCQANGTWSDNVPTCDPVDCESLTNPQNGEVTLTTTTFMSTATYSCNSGYILSGNETRTCEASGTWSDTAPTCDPVDCGRLPTPSSGQLHVSFTTTTLGSTASYHCISGYTLSENITRRCEADGAWSGTEPTCVVDCGTLAAPQNGKVTLTATTFMSTANYSCNSGYTLSGNETRTCEASGTWSDTAPTCDPVDCGRLLTPSSGQLQVSFTMTTLGSTASYHCSSGYTLSENITRRCEADGAWSGTEPTCVVDCGTLAAPQNGKVTLTTATFMSTANYSCNSGYTLSGNETRTCEATGTWSGITPTCDPVDCGTLAAPLNGQVTLTTTTFMSTATYSCNSGYTLSGNETRTCEANGTWSDTAPTCDLSCDVRFCKTCDEDLSECSICDDGYELDPLKSCIVGGGGLDRAVLIGLILGAIIAFVILLTVILCIILGIYRLREHSNSAKHASTMQTNFSSFGNVIQNPFYISSNQVENKWEEAENEEKEENLWEQTDDDKEKRMQESP